jgi:hypothetical protein
MVRVARLLLALSLLSSAATASAECAWVLWEHSYEVWIDSNKGKSSARWLLEESHRDGGQGGLRRPHGARSASRVLRPDR